MRTPLKKCVQFAKNAYSRKNYVFNASKSSSFVFIVAYVFFVCSEKEPVKDHLVQRLETQKTINYLGGSTRSIMAVLPILIDCAPLSMFAHPYWVWSFWGSVFRYPHSSSIRFWRAQQSVTKKHLMVPFETRELKLIFPPLTIANRNRINIFCWYGNIFSTV